MKKIISLILALIIVSTAVPMSASAVPSNTTDVALRFKTDKSIYTLGETVVFTVTAVNSSEELQSVRLTVDPKDDYLFKFGSSFDIENIPAMGEKTVEYKMEIVKKENNSFFAILGKLFGGFLYLFTRFDYKVYVNVKGRNNDVGFKVKYIAPIEKLPTEPTTEDITTKPAEPTTKPSITNVTGLKAVNITENSVSLKWEPCAGAASYYVYYIKSGEKVWKLASTVTSTDFTVKELEEGTDYRFIVRAGFETESETVLGDYSNIVSVKTIE